MNLILVDNIKKYFKNKTAVDGVSFSINPGQTLGLVGESGCGKTTLARVLMNLERPTSGNAYIHGKSVFTMSRRQISKEMRMIFQNPNAALNPQMKVREILAEAVATYQKAEDIPEKGRNFFSLRLKTLTKKKPFSDVDYFLSEVKFPSNSLDKYPHELSGGEKRRVAIARALVTYPKLILADEPVSALDVSIQAQIMELFSNLQREHGIAYLFISHDLNTVDYISHRIAVMFLGKIVEIGDKNEITNNPLHPYTRSLLSAVLPVGCEAKSHLKRVAGNLNWEISHQEQNSGCSYRFRCSEYKKLSSSERSSCDIKRPELHVVEGVDHSVACYRKFTDAITGGVENA